MPAMGSEQFVNVSYRGIDVGAALKMIEFGPTTAYLELTTPMPVGTTLDVETEGGVSLRATVVRIQEQVAGAEMPPGMRVRAIELGADASAWWKSAMSGADPVIPEPRLQLSTETAPVQQEEAAPVPAPVPEPEPAPEPEAEAIADDHQPRSTMIMDVSEIQAAIAAGGDVADLADAVPAEMDAQPTNPVPAPGANGDSSQDDSGGDKKKKKRRRRK
jgi:hypothetical protein